MFLHGCEQTFFVGHHFGWRTLFVVNIPCKWLSCRLSLLYPRNVKDRSSYFPPTSVSALLSSPNHVITSVAVRPNGAPIINCSNGVVYSYDPSLYAFVKLTERWWAEGSDVWQGRQRQNVQNTNRGVMSSVEGSIGGTPPNEGNSNVSRPSWWSTALTLGHLETRLHATRLLDSPQEFKQAMLVYAKKIADEGFRGKAEELIKELFGPVYSCVLFSTRRLFD